MKQNVNRKPDKVHGNVMYYDDEHVYIDKETQSKYVSVTTLIHNYQNEFDSVFWSSYKALEALMEPQYFEIIKKSLLTKKKFNPEILKKYNIDEQIFYDKRIEILNGYEEEKNKSCERGTKIHAEFENQFYEKPQHSLKKYGIEGNFECKPNYYELDLQQGIYPEYLIHLKSKDGKLMVAGQIDLLIKDGNDIYIWDYKTNKELKKKSYFDSGRKKNVMMKFPLNHIMDCNYYHYTLQLSLYAYLLKQINPEFNIKELKLIHIDHSGKIKEHVVEYRENDVQRMLQHYKKQLITREQLDRDIAPKI